MFKLPIWDPLYPWHPLGPIHTEILVIVLVMQKWVETFSKEWVEYPFLAMPTNINAITNAQCEWTLTPSNIPDTP